jgi:hypothetical protein
LTGARTLERRYDLVAFALIALILHPAVAHGVTHADEGCFLPRLHAAPPPATVHPDENFRSRVGPVRMIVIHSTGGPSCNPDHDFVGGTLASTLRLFRSIPLSTHYVIGREGTLVQMVDRDLVAYHARANNADSIGIELVNDGDGKDPFSFAQMTRLYELLTYLMGRYDLTTANVTTHAQLDRRYMRCEPPSLDPITGGVDAATPGARKVKQDPGPLFPWGAFVRSLREIAPRHVAWEHWSFPFPIHDCELGDGAPSASSAEPPPLLR